MKRSFVGLSFEEDPGPQFHDMFRKLKTSADRKKLNVKWSPLKNLHFTLKFLGEVDEDRIKKTISSLKDLTPTLKPLCLKLQGLGGFPDEIQTRVLWMGVKNKRGLRELQQQVEEALNPLDFPSDSQEFIPHITLGRFRNRISIKDLISPFVRKDFGEIPVRKITLFESVLQGNFPIYKVIDEFDLNLSESH